MRILALDTSSPAAGIALLEDGRPVVELCLDTGRHHAETLLPAIGAACTWAGWEPETPDLYAVTLGPGSFTGVRIGASTVKGLALATGRPATGVSTLEALAWNGLPAERICPMLDAQRGQVYTALYGQGAGETLELLSPERVSGIADILCGLSGEVLFLGGGALRYAREIRERLGTGARFAPAHLHRVQPAVVGRLGQRNDARGEHLDLCAFAPRYLRPSEAEAQEARAGRVEKS